MKMYKMLAPLAVVLIIATSCGENNSGEAIETTSENTTTVSPADSTQKADSGKTKEGINVSIKGASIDISGEEGKVETKTGTDVQINKDGLKVNSKDVKVNIGHRP